jgi:hypothetical protein
MWKFPAPVTWDKLSPVQPTISWKRPTLSANRRSASNHSTMEISEPDQNQSNLSFSIRAFVTETGENPPVPRRSHLGAKIETWGKYCNWIWLNPATLGDLGQSVTHKGSLNKSIAPPVKPFSWPEMIGPSPHWGMHGSPSFDKNDVLII